MGGVKRCKVDHVDRRLLLLRKRQLRGQVTEMRIGRLVLREETHWLGQR